ncbi:MAG: hypothetical protein KatS3mg023_4089 [Armatimonadota bacterium]|nr:MAG: hypothetical protein KatS3mg023_4089 [Armatimonadota bacterium]
MNSSTVEPTSKNIYWKLAHSLLTDSMNVTCTSSLPVTSQVQPRDTRQIVSTAGAAAWLPHSKLRNTRMTSGQGNQPST